jgi:hypothetical protein
LGFISSVHQSAYCLLVDLFWEIWIVFFIISCLFLKNHSRSFDMRNPEMLEFLRRLIIILPLFKVLSPEPICIPKSRRICIWSSRQWTISEEFGPFCDFLNFSFSSRRGSCKNFYFKKSFDFFALIQSVNEGIYNLYILQIITRT